MKIICIGRNYVAHAKELQNAVPESPVFFMKPDTALLQKNNPFFYPDFTSDLHYETELVLRISRNGRHIDEAFASRYYDAITVGIDFTARDVQNELKSKGLPWEKAKAFDQSAPLGRFIPIEALPDRNSINFHLDINGERRQQGNSSQMIFSFDTLIAYVSKFVTLRMGDYLFTGTPAGVGPTNKGDHFEVWLEGENLLTFDVK